MTFPRSRPRLPARAALGCSLKTGLQTLTAGTVYGMKIVRCSSLDENNCGVVIDTSSRVLVPGPIYMQFNSVRSYFTAA